MTFDADEIFEHRVLSAEDLGPIVKLLREQKQWTQATLAELSGLTDRTVQRVEKGESAGRDARCAIARGFGFDDIEVFNKPFPVLNEEKYKKHLANLESSTVVVDIVHAQTAHVARTMIEGAESSANDYIGETSPVAREAFAALVDNLRDYNDIRDCYGESQRLEFDASLQEFLDQVEKQGCAVGVGKRHAMVQFANDPPGSRAMSWTNIFFILAPEDQLPTKIRVPKVPSLG